MAQISLDSHGVIKVTTAPVSLERSVSGELRLREAFLRRALAFDQACLLSLLIQKPWHDQLFRTMPQKAPEDHLY